MEVSRKEGLVLEKDSFTCPCAGCNAYCSSFATPEIMELINSTYFGGTRQLGNTNRQMIRILNPTFVIFATTALWHALSAYKTGT
jgi:hypothetical protein